MAGLKTNLADKTAMIENGRIIPPKRAEDSALQNSSETGSAGLDHQLGFQGGQTT